jgi:hypothetical protein
VKSLLRNLMRELIRKVFSLISNNGSSRDVFKIHAERVVKVAKNATGAKQNKTEYDVYMNATLKEKHRLTPVIDISDDNSVLIVSIVEPFPENANIPSFAILKDLIYRYDLYEPDLEEKENWGVYGSSNRGNSEFWFKRTP